jgi:6-phosphogluconolactonase
MIEAGERGRGEGEGESRVPKREIQTFTDLETLSEAAAAEIAAIAAASVAARGRFIIALAGGNTPRRTYELLAERDRDAKDWRHTDVVFGDERNVPPADERSNYRMARDALLAHVPVSDQRVHTVPTEAPSADRAAEEYEQTLRRVVMNARSTASGAIDPAADGTPTVDLALLGLGVDGHTASLFPDSPALRERTRWVCAVGAPIALQPAVPRVTTTLAFLDRARAVIFLVSGADKRRVLSEILASADPPQRYPAALVAPRGRLVWMVDRSALPA